MDYVATRSGDVRKTFFGELYKEEPVFLPKNKLCNGVFIIGRMLHLTKTEKGKRTTSKGEASLIVAGELRDDWIDKNVYPCEERTVAAKILKDFETFKSFRKNREQR
ncbi:hypothetical protein SNE40_021552 [Patella caerulea]|uniref:Uncharacterized protein n=1 Tax=Patella caerulea TaxID=87958 RepID=A0AAN8J0M0_PATCE